MAIVYAIKTGVWSDTTVWNTGALPTTADDVYSNTFTVTINTDATVLSVRNTSAPGVTQGGRFLADATITLTCTGSGVIASNPSCIQSTLPAGQSFNLVSNLTAVGGTNNQSGLLHSGAGTVNITGDCTGGSQNLNNMAVNNNGSGTIIVTGLCRGGSSDPTSWAVQNNSTGTVLIIGQCEGGSVAPAAVNNSSGTLIVQGFCVASAGYAAIGIGSASQVTILYGPLLYSPQSSANVGVNPCIALRWFVPDDYLEVFEYQMTGETMGTAIRPERIMRLTERYMASYPSPSDVRGQAQYGPNNIYTGTCAIPNAASVQQGVSVDNTTGTVAVGSSTIRAAFGLSSANLESQLSSINSTINQIPPAVRTELAPELARASNIAMTSDVAQLVAAAA